MKAHTIRVITTAAITLIAVATYILWPESPSLELSTTAMPSLEELHAQADVHNLPIQDVDDQMLVYSTGTNQ